MPYTLPSLSYPYEALEPHIDAQTMQIHHTKHHQTYIDKVNAALQGTPWDGKPIDEVLAELAVIPADKQTIVRNHGGGHSNHTFFWQIIGPNGGGKPSVTLGKEMDEVFGTFESFQEKFTAAAVGQFGSGWAWLVWNGGGLEILATSNQDSPLSDGKKPLLGIDIWEHAYYLKYQNRRPDYIKAWWNVVKWEEVEKRFMTAKSA